MDKNYLVIIPQYGTHILDGKNKRKIKKKIRAIIYSYGHKDIDVAAIVRESKIIELNTTDTLSRIKLK